MVTETIKNRTEQHLNCDWPKMFTYYRFALNVSIDGNFSLCDYFCNQKGNRSETGNYRPISLTCIVRKVTVLESMVKRVIVEHVEDNKLIKISQHGFMKGCSCLTNLLDFFEEIYDELDTNNQVDPVYLDFAKAFDKVPHKRLIRKMQACGIQGSILQWIMK